MMRYFFEESPESLISRMCSGDRESIGHPLAGWGESYAGKRWKMQTVACEKKILIIVNSNTYIKLHMSCTQSHTKSIFWSCRKELDEHDEAGSDGRLAGHFTKLAELERPPKAWEVGKLEHQQHWINRSSSFTVYKSKHHFCILSFFLNLDADPFLLTQ